MDKGSAAMKMPFFKTKPTPNGRRRPTLALCLLVALMVHDARAHPRPLVAHIANVADGSRNSSISMNFLHPSSSSILRVRTSTQLADIAAESPDNGVVVDWQSVCEHLCSSNLWGSGCGSRCVGSLSARQTNYIGNDFLSGCPFLCSIRLGDARCYCAPTLSDDIFHVSPADQDAVCQLGCTTGYQLIGCSECPESTTVVGVEHSNKTLYEVTELATEPSDVYHGTTTYTVEDDSDVDETTETSDTTEPSGEPTALESEAPLTTTESVSTATTTTTTTTAEPSTITTTTTTTTTQKTTTTPDWNELCQNLCRIGEGGALCNCDLPPFF